MPSQRACLASMFTECMTNADDPPKAGVDEHPDPERQIYRQTVSGRVSDATQAISDRQRREDVCGFTAENKRLNVDWHIVPVLC